MSLNLTSAQLQLLRQALVETNSGIHLSNFATQIGIPRARARIVIKRIGDLLDSQPHDADLMPLGNVVLGLSTSDARAFRNALELVMMELGKHDFQTRTGFYLAEGAQMLDELNAAVIAPLHIEKKQQAVSQQQVAQSR